MLTMSDRDSQRQPSSRDQSSILQGSNDLNASLSLASSVRAITTTTIQTSIHSVCSTHTTQSNNSSTLRSWSVVTTTSSTSVLNPSNHSHTSSGHSLTSAEEQLRSIQLELEDLGGIRTDPNMPANSSRRNNPASRSRAGFNSIRDALGNLRSRLVALGDNLHHHHREENPSDSSQNHSRRHVSLLQQLSDRLHMIDAAHSSFVPVHIIAQRRRSHSSTAHNMSNVDAQTSSSGVIIPENYASIASTSLGAPIFRFSVRESFVSFLDQPASVTAPAPVPSSRSEQHRSSLLFASRLMAHRSIVEGRGSILLVAGGDIESENGMFIGISSFTSTGLDSMNGRGSMRDLGRDNSENDVRPFFDLDMHFHPSVARQNLSAVAERVVGSRGSSIESEHSVTNLVTTSMSKKDNEDNDSMNIDLHNFDDCDSVFVDESYKKIKTEEDDDEFMQPVDMTEVVAPILTRKADSSELSLSDTQHDHLSGSFYASPKKESFEIQSMDIDVTTSSDNYMLYSWGCGSQSLHDDNEDRSPLAMLEKSQSTTSITQNLQVVSRLGSKSILAVSIGQHHSVCATAQGTLYVAGNNLHGCVDPDSPVNNIYPRPILLESISQIKVVQVSCGYDHTAALSSNGSVLTWGCNSDGQLGHRTNNLVNATSCQGPTHCRPAGMILGKGRRASAIACGTSYTMVLTTRMALLVCGTPSIAGYRESSDWGTLKELPSLVGLPLVKISAGHMHACVLTAHGTALIWGKNIKGCCGREFPGELTQPVPVKVSSSFDSNEEKLTIKSKLHLPFTNWEMQNQVDGMVVKLTDDVAIQHVACGSQHTILISRSGRLLVCGNNDRGQLGITESEKPVYNAIPVYHPREGVRFVAAEAGNAHSLLLDSAGDVWLTTPKGLKCIIEGKNILAIAAGGDDNSVAVASGDRILKRQFSVDSSEDGNSIVENVERLLEAIDFDSTNVTHDGQEIARLTEVLLRYPAVLNSLFMDPKELDDMFERIKKGNLETKKNIAHAIERGLICGLESLQDNTRLIYPEAVRCLLLYIKFFDIRNDDDLSFDVRGDCVMSFCDTILGLPFEGYRALHGWATNLYSNKLFVKMLVHPLLLSLNASLKFYVDENQVQHFQPSRRSVPVIIGVLSWLYTIADEAHLASPTDFYSDGVSQIDVQVLFRDLCEMKRAGRHERSKNFYICAHPFLLSPGCKRNLLQMESRMEQYKAMLGDIKISEISLNQHRIIVDPFFHLEIEREHLLEQTLKKIKQTDPKEVRKQLKVSFKGEDGLDAGGVTKEFFQLLSEDLFDVHSGLWSNKYGDEINWFNSDNTWDIKGYELVGILFGLALYNSVLLDVHFPLAVYRKILGLPLGLEDIIDNELRRGLQQLLDYEEKDIEQVFCLTFEITWMQLGEEQRLELKPGGSDIPVTNDNREEYVLRYVRWILVDSVKQQWESFQKGVMTLMESSSLDLFLPEELELLVVGSPELDFDALEANTKYEGGYDKNSDTIINFWKFVKESSKETQVKLLKFVTASSKAPIGGLGKLPFIIQRAGPDSHQLPTSHTCFNTLLLPDYNSNYEKLASCLGLAVKECEGFGLE